MKGTPANVLGPDEVIREWQGFSPHTTLSREWIRVVVHGVPQSRTHQTMLPLVRCAILRDDGVQNEQDRGVLVGHGGNRKEELQPASGQQCSHFD